MTRAGRIACAVAAILAAGAALEGCRRPGPVVPGAGEPLTFTTDDGVTLAATFYSVATAPDGGPPGLVLIHDEGGDRSIWRPFARKAAQSGYACLAFDLRGHGESVRKNGATLVYSTFRAENWRDALHDIDAARRALLGRGADPSNIALAGAGVGANLALLYAEAHSEVPAVVLLSPGLEYQGLSIRDAIVATGARPVLLMTASGDAYSAMSCAALKRDAAGLCELREYPGTAHGIDLLDLSLTAQEQVLLWLKPIIGMETPGDL